MTPYDHHHRGARESGRGRRAAHARRRRTRRRRLAASVLAVAAVVVLIVAVTGKGTARHPSGSSPGAGSDGHDASTSARAHAGAAPSNTRPSSGQADGEAIESSQVRSLIALGKSIYCAGHRGDEVALTFDDGPGTYTKLAIAKLRKHGVKATFFIVGRNIPLLPGAIREERALGAVGDHTFTHPLLTALAPTLAESEIVRTQAAMERAFGGLGVSVPTSLWGAQRDD